MAMICYTNCSTAGQKKVAYNGNSFCDISKNLKTIDKQQITLNSVSEDDTFFFIRQKKVYFFVVSLLKVGNLENKYYLNGLWKKEQIFQNISGFKYISTFFLIILVLSSGTVISWMRKKIFLITLEFCSVLKKFFFFLINDFKCFCFVFVARQKSCFGFEAFLLMAKLLIFLWL